MSLALLAMSPGRFAEAGALDGVAGELFELFELARQRGLASRVLSRALALPAVTPPQYALPPLASRIDWLQAAGRVGLAYWAPALRRVVAREPRQRLMQALGADGYRTALALPALAITALAESLPEPAAVAETGHALLAQAIAAQGSGWAEHARAVFGEDAMVPGGICPPGLDSLLPAIGMVP